MAVCEIGTTVKVLPTGDPDIDKYKGQIGSVVKIEPNQLLSALREEEVKHYHVQMTDGFEIVINSQEFEIVG